MKYLEYLLQLGISTEYKSTPVLKLFRTFTGKMTRGLSLRMVFSLLFQDTLLSIDTARGLYDFQ